MLALVLHGPGDLRVEEQAPARGVGVRVGIELGGICGTDLHYFKEGRVAERVVREPLVLGHELVGKVQAVEFRGEDDSSSLPAVGSRVAIDPSRPCGRCASCAIGASNLCLEARFLGSAALVPHVQGGFREQLTVAPSQCVPLPDALGFEKAVFAEPLAVAVHALGRVRASLAGRSLLVTGAGPIGALVAALAVHEGADVTIADLNPGPLARAGRLASLRALDARELPGLGEEFDLAVEASGAPSALARCIEMTARNGTVVGVGMFPAGAAGPELNGLMTREVELRGSFRFAPEEFRRAVDLLAGGELDPEPLLTAVVPLTDGADAFRLAVDRGQASKVLLRPAG